MNKKIQSCVDNRNGINEMVQVFSENINKALDEIAIMKVVTIRS